MNSDRVELDGKKRKLILHGSCLELGPVCAAACCRQGWAIVLSDEEYASGLYAAEPVCYLTDKACDEKVATCFYRRYQLRKDADGACVHLDDSSNLCSIYQDRPKVCRDFSCAAGWRLGSVFPVGEDRTTSRAELDRDTFVQRLNDEMTFVPHPLMKLLTVFYAKARGEITFVKKRVGTCGKFYTRDSLSVPQLDDDLLLHLIRLFDSKDTLAEVRQRFCSQHATSLTQEEFYAIVWLLNKHNIILEARNFRGMLAGMGAI